MKKFYFEIDPKCPVCEYKIEEDYANAHKWGIGENKITIDENGKGTIECLCYPHEVADRVYFIDDNGEAYFGIVGDLISDDSEEEEEEYISQEDIDYDNACFDADMRDFEEAAQRY